MTKRQFYSLKRSSRHRRGTRGYIPSYAKGYLRKGGYYRGRTGTTDEKKFHDVDVDDAVISATGTIIANSSLNLIAQGTTESERIGRKCTIKNINFRYTVFLPAVADAVPTNDIVRIIVYLDQQCNGATIGVTDLLESANWQSFLKLENVGRFRVLHDRQTVLNQTCGAGGSTAANDFPEVAKNVSFYKECNIPIEFSATTGALTEIRSNNIGVLTISKKGVATLDGKVRLRFTG